MRFYRGEEDTVKELEENGVQIAELGLEADAFWPQSPYWAALLPLRLRAALTQPRGLPRPGPRPWP